MNRAAQNYIRSTRLNDVLDLQHIARGVNMEITQLDPGAFESDVSQLKVRNVLASLISPNKRLRLQGKVNYLTVSFLSHESESPKWHGISAGPGDILAANAGETFDLVVPPGVAAHCISVIGNSEVALRKLGGPVLADKLSGTARPIPCDPDALRKIRTWFAERFDSFAVDSEIRNGPASELEQEFLLQLAACMRAGQPSSNSGDSTVPGRIDVARRVEQHLLEDPAIPLTIDDLCRVAGTSRRTLEYAFRDYFGTSPKRFIKALRLNAARDDLLHVDYGSAQVMEIASGWGFTHMGQFSADYRRMFGEKPSETLRRSLPHVHAEI
jgi:AraC family ethanolamine operon transcriptional activator